MIRHFRTLARAIGVIGVIGVIAGALLVGALWHVASIGDAIDGARGGLMLRNDGKVAHNVARVLGAMNAVESAVATATPLVALGTAKGNTGSAYEVESAWTQRMSLLPSITDKGFQPLKGCAKGVKAGKITKTDPTSAIGKKYKLFNDHFNQARMGFVVSLPVQAETYGLLCDQAGQFLFNTWRACSRAWAFRRAPFKASTKPSRRWAASSACCREYFARPLVALPPGSTTSWVDEPKRLPPLT